MPPPRILTQTVFCCPDRTCYKYFQTVEETFEHVIVTHPSLGGIGGDSAIEAAIRPITIFDDDKSEIHICQKCNMLLPTVESAKKHLTTTLVHQPKVILSRLANNLNKLLPRVQFEIPEHDRTTPPTRIVFQQSNWIYSDNRIVNIVNEAGAQAPGAEINFPSTTIDNPDEQDVIGAWICVESLHPVVVYQQKNHIHGKNAHVTILNGPPAWESLGRHQVSISDPPIVFCYEQNNRLYGDNTIVNIVSGPFGEDDPIRYVQNNYLFGKTHLLNGNHNIHLKGHKNGFISN